MSESFTDRPTAAAPFAEGFLQGAGGLSPDSLFRENEPLARKTTLGVGGAARYYAEPASAGDLSLLLRAARRGGVRVYLLGRGSNVIIPDAGVDGLVIRLQRPAWREVIARGERRLWAGAGVRLRKLCGEACRRGLAGMEFLEGIPGTVGGALRMNAGAMGGWFFDIVEEVRVMTFEGEKKVFLREELHYDYRVCHELLDTIALGVFLRAPDRGEAAVIRKKLGEFQQRRTCAQPKESSAGCVFKNPPGAFAGGIIDELGLKGRRVGEAEVSAVHGNFIVNRGGATASQVVELIRTVRAEVRERKGVTLEPEVLLFGAEWKEVL